MACSVTSQW